MDLKKSRKKNSEEGSPSACLKKPMGARMGTEEEQSVKHGESLCSVRGS